MIKYSSYLSLLNKNSSQNSSLILKIKFIALKLNVSMLCYKIMNLMSKLNIKKVAVKAILLLLFGFHISFAGKFPQEAFFLEVINKENCSVQSPKNCQFKLKIYQLKR